MVVGVNTVGLILGAGQRHPGDDERCCCTTLSTILVVGDGAAADGLPADGRNESIARVAGYGRAPSGRAARPFRGRLRVQFGTPARSLLQFRFAHIEGVRRGAATIRAFRTLHLPVRRAG